MCLYLSVFPSQSNATIATTDVAAEPPVVNQLECRPDVPGISDRRTGAFLLIFLYQLLLTFGRFIRNEITKAITIAFNKSIPFFKHLKILYLVYNISDKIS